MTVLSSKDSFKRINLDSLVLNASGDSSLSWSTTTGVPTVYIQTGYGHSGASVSTDMINWNTNPNAFTDSTAVHSGPVRLGEGLFLSVSSNGWFTSTDGYTWSNQGIPMDVTMTDYQSLYVDNSPNLVAANGLYTFFPLRANIAVKSTDAQNWTTVSLPVAAWSFTYANGQYVIQDNMGQTYTSSDLSTWTNVGSTYQQASGALLTYANGYYIRLVQGMIQYEFSTDLIGWQDYNLPGWDFNAFTSITYGNGKFLCNPGYATAPISQSTDLINWTYISTCPVSENLISFINNKFYYFNRNTPSNSYESTDGVSWTSVNLDKIGYAYLVATGGDFTASLQITSSGIETTEDITAGSFFGDGSGLTGI
jgi:hypothetical protein